MEAATYTRCGFYKELRDELCAMYASCHFDEMGLEYGTSLVLEKAGVQKIYVHLIWDSGGGNLELINFRLPEII